MVDVPFKVMIVRASVKMKARLKEATELQLSCFPHPIKVQNIEVEFRNNKEGELVVTFLTVKYIHPADDELYPLILLFRDEWHTTWLADVVREMRDRASNGYGPQVGSPIKVVDEMLDWEPREA